MYYAYGGTGVMISFYTGVYVQQMMVPVCPTVGKKREKKLTSRTFK